MPGDSPRLDRPRRWALALACLGLAAFAHERCCEWRTLEYETAQASAFEERVLWTVRREEHTSGNAAAWDQKQRELRAYYTDWVACWEVEGKANRSLSALADCRSQLDPRANATVQAVALASCEDRLSRRVSRSRGFRRCLAERGHRESPTPRWTRDVFGIRFDEPYVTLTALFAEDLGGSAARSRGLGAGLGVGLPIGLLAAALLLAQGRV